MTDNRTADRVDHSPRVRDAIDELMRKKDATDNRTTELASIIKALEKLAAAVTWTMPTDARSVRANLNEAFDVIDKLKELVPDDR